MIDWIRVADRDMAESPDLPALFARIKIWVDMHLSQGHRVEQHKLDPFNEHILMAKDGKVERLDVSVFNPSDPFVGYEYRAYES